jgi:pyridoxine 4-dehydrogenase
MLADATIGTFMLGKNLQVRRLGFGTIYLTTGRGFGPPRFGARVLLTEAVRLGVNFIDTADSYGPEHAENLIREALHPYHDVVIATKGGFKHPSEDVWQPDGRPAHLRTALEGSLKRLQVDRIDLYQLHVPDPNVPYGESIGALRDLQAEGKIRHIGVSNVTLDQLKEACQEVEVVSVQNPYNVAYRENEEVLKFCEDQSIAFIPWMPLGEGPTAISGYAPVDHMRVVKRIANKHNVTVAQVLLAALLQRSQVMIPIPGTGSLDHLQENIEAASLQLDANDLTQLWS